MLWFYPVKCAENVDNCTWALAFSTASAIIMAAVNVINQHQQQTSCLCKHLVCCLETNCIIL